MADSAWVRPAGLVWTTPTQMMAWARFIMEGDPALLADELRSEMAVPHVNTLPGTDLMYYGYGLPGFVAQNGQWYEVPIIEHGGNTLSFTHVFLFVDGEALDITFIAETPEGPSTYLRNRAVVATRVAKTAAAKKRVAILPPADLKRRLERAALPSQTLALRQLLLRGQNVAHVFRDTE
jgi:CubicO group peptidase (beta-lactamase class C family)